MITLNEKMLKDVYNSGKEDKRRFCIEYIDNPIISKRFKKATSNFNLKNEELVVVYKYWVEGFKNSKWNDADTMIHNLFKFSTF